MTAYKTCAHCSARKGVEDFHRKSEMPDGRRGICKECVAAKARIYRQQNHEKVKESKRRWAVNNPQSAIEASRRMREKGVKTKTSSVSLLRDSDPSAYDKLSAKWAKRRADRLKATPKWFDPQKVASIYAQAGRMRRAGFDVHVDHIIPLRGATACGLHVHHNLRIISATENLSKGAKLL